MPQEVKPQRPPPPPPTHPTTKGRPKSIKPLEEHEPQPQPKAKARGRPKLYKHSEPPMIQEAIPEHQPQPNAKAKGRPKKANPPAEAKRDRSRSKGPHDEVLEDEKRIAQNKQRY